MQLSSATQGARKTATATMPAPSLQQDSEPSSPSVSGRLFPGKLRTSLVASSPPRIFLDHRTSSGDQKTEVTQNDQDAFSPETAHERLNHESQRLNMALKKLQERPAVEDAEKRLGSMLTELSSRVAQCLTSISEKVSPHHPWNESTVVPRESINGKDFEALLQELHARIADCSHRVCQRATAQAMQQSNQLIQWSKGAQAMQLPVPSTIDWGQPALEQPVARPHDSANFDSESDQGPSSTRTELEILREAIEAIRGQIDLTLGENARLEQQCEKYHSQVNCLLHLRKLKGRAGSPPKAWHPQQASGQTQRVIAISPHCVPVPVQPSNIHVVAVSRDASPERHLAEHASPEPSSPQILASSGPRSPQMRKASPVRGTSGAPQVTAISPVTMPAPMAVPATVGVPMPCYSWQVPTAGLVPSAQQVHVVSPTLSESWPIRAEHVAHGPRNRRKCYCP